MMVVRRFEADTKRACSHACSGLLRRGKAKGPGGRFKRSDGYISVYYPSHPDAAKHRGIMMEHRLVMEEKLGRRLLPDETVNHINHIRDDNRPENLELLSWSDHARESNAFGRDKRRAMAGRLRACEARCASLTARLAAYESKYGPLD